MKLCSFLLVCLIASCFATRGFDHSLFQGLNERYLAFLFSSRVFYLGAVSQSSYSCLKANGYEFGIIQAQGSNGQFNEYVIANVQHAHGLSS